MLRRPPRSTRTDTLFPTRRSSDLLSFGISPWLGMLAGAASGAALGAVLGFVIFRRKLTGIFFALVTLAVAEMRSEEHTSELQSLMRISYAVFCLKKKKQQRKTKN